MVFFNYESVVFHKKVIKLVKVFPERTNDMLGFRNRLERTLVMVLRIWLDVPVPNTYTTPELVNITKIIRDLVNSVIPEGDVRISDWYVI